MNPLADDITARLDLALSAGREAGRLTLDYFQRPIKVRRKTDDSPVTVADHRAEELLRQRIGDAFPDDAILGEEFPETPGTTGFRWIVDPIDGTKSFISGVPLYGTMVAVEHDGRGIVGVIDIPALRECIYAAQGSGAWHLRGDGKPQPAQVSSCDKLSEATFVTTQVDNFARRGAAAAFQRLQSAAYVTRTWGDCYGYLLVATGRALVMVDPIMSIWDAAAIQPIIEEAGGAFTDWRGTPTIHSGEGVATNGKVVEQVLAITREYPQKGGA